MSAQPKNFIHPGEVLTKEFLVPLGISTSHLATSLGVPANRIAALVNGEEAITADTAVLLGKAFNTTPEFWTGLQAHYDLEMANAARTQDLDELVAAAQKLNLGY